jgi:hypothetical protein
MTDQITQPLPRVFKVGTTRIVEDDSTRNLTNEQMKTFLKASYPEVANATISERSDGTTRMVEFLPQPGRKG